MLGGHGAVERDRNRPDRVALSRRGSAPCAHCAAPRARSGNQCCPASRSCSSCSRSSSSCVASARAAAMTHARSPTPSCSSARPAISPSNRYFPALNALVNRDGLEIPIIGMGRSGLNLEKLQARAKQSLEHAGKFDADRFREAGGAAALRRRRLRRPGDLQQAAQGARARRSARSTISPFRRACSAASCRASPIRAAPRMRASSSRSPSAATWRLRRRSTPRCTRCSPRKPSSASITTSARRRCKISLYFRFANRFLEPIWNRDNVQGRADHHGRELRRPRPRRFLRGSRARSATWCRIICCR